MVQKEKKKKTPRKIFLAFFVFLDATFGKQLNDNFLIKTCVSLLFL